MYSFGDERYIFFTEWCIALPYAEPAGAAIKRDLLLPKQKQLFHYRPICGKLLIYSFVEAFDVRGILATYTDDFMSYASLDRHHDWGALGQRIRRSGSKR